RAASGQVADRREEQSGLRGQSHSVPDGQRSDLRAAGRARYSGGHRQRHEAGLQSPDRSARAGRLDRPRCDVGGDERVLHRLQRSEIPAGAAVEGNGRRRLSGTQDETGLLPVRLIKKGPEDRRIAVRLLNGLMLLAMAVLTSSGQAQSPASTPAPTSLRVIAFDGGW